MGGFAPSKNLSLSPSPPGGEGSSAIEENYDFHPSGSRLSGDLQNPC
jgi:hypothetical protein